MSIQKIKLFLQSNNASGNINTGMLYIIAIMILLFCLGYLVTGPTPTHSAVPNGTEVVIGKPKQEDPKARLQLYTFTAATITPPASSLCQKGGANKNPDLIIATSPSNGTGIQSDSQVKVWINDTAPIKIAPAELVTRGSGAISSAGDRTARAPDGYIWEPAVYIMPNTIDANGTPFFPTFIRGAYNNGDTRVSYGADQVPNNVTFTDKGRSVELIWNVKDLNLGPGAYQLQFVAHDDNANMAVKCISMRVYQAPDIKTAIPDQ